MINIARTLGGGLELTGVMRYPLLAHKVISALLDLAVENSAPVILFAFFCFGSK